MKSFIKGGLVLVASVVLLGQSVLADRIIKGDPKPAMIIFSQKNDGGWSQALDEARQKVEAELGLTIPVVENVPEKEVVNMNRRLSGADPSLNAKISTDDGSQTEWQDWIEADAPNQEEEYVEKEEDTIRKELISEALNILNERELDIVQTRRLSEETSTLEELSEKYDISRERVRQIEVRALEKIKEEIQKLMKDKNIIDL